MSPLPARMIKKKEVVLNSVAEFLGIWAVKGQATLSLTTQDGVTTVTFSHSLSGHPEDPLHPPPAAPRRCRRRRHCGPARRERDRLRAVRHQAALAGVPPASPSSAVVSAASSTPEVLRSREQSNLATLNISPNNGRREENEDLSTLDRSDPPEPLPTCASPPTSSTSTLAEMWDFLKRAEEQRQEDRRKHHQLRTEHHRNLQEIVQSFTSSSCDKSEAE